MKISQIEIKDYNQFKNLTLDFTYPKGHQKEGKPLNKVCLLGQSGTGKTSLLNVIRAILTANLTREHEHLLKGTLTEKFQQANMNHIVMNCCFNAIKSRIEITYGKNLGKNRLVSFPAEIITNINQQIQEQPAHPISYLKTVAEIQQHSEPLKVFDFETDNLLEIWNEISLSISAQEGERAFENYKRWKTENPNPIEQLAQQLEPILKQFSLAVKTSFDFESAEDLKFIEIQSVDGTEIPYSGWSTGTVLLTMTPLFKLNTDDSIILLDEPERSLYPDIQTQIINDYSQLAPKAQLFFATHSPIIASAFEPWEIVELKLSRQGTVYQEKYYQGERHVDNYFIDPRYLRWDVILMRVFDLAVEGNEKFRTQALTQAARLEAKYNELRG